MGQPNRREREALKHRGEILEAAEHLFAKRGFFKTSMAEIAREAEFSVGSLYQFFESKDAIYVALLEEKFDNYIAMVRRDIGRANDVPGKIEAMIRAKLGFFEQNRDFFRIYVSEWGGSEWTMRSDLGKEVWKKYQAYLGLITKVIRAGVREGLFRKSNPREMAYLFTGMTNILIHQWILGPGRESLIDKAGLIQDVFLKGVTRRGRQ